jgi:hypothetical protein
MSATAGIGALGTMTYSWIHPPADQVDPSARAPTARRSRLSGLAATCKAQGVGRRAFKFDVSLTRARYVRFAVKHHRPDPGGLSPGAGNPAWLFLDEIGGALNTA